MLIILSPAKTLDFSEVDKAIGSTVPLGTAESDYLAGEIKKLSVTKLKSLLGVSDNLARQNHDRFKQWGSQEKKQCVLTYDGPAYRSLSATQLKTADLEFAQSHLRILSGLYGVLRPLDLIQPYRLEMGSKLENSSGKNLYIYWKDRIRAWLAKDLGAAPAKEQFLVNCASQEYAKAVDMQGLNVPVYEMCFPGPGLHAKAARGALARFIILNRITNPEQLKEFTGEPQTVQWYLICTQPLLLRRSCGVLQASVTNGNIVLNNRQKQSLCSSDKVPTRQRSKKPTDTLLLVEKLQQATSLETQGNKIQLDIQAISLQMHDMLLKCQILCIGKLANDCVDVPLLDY